MKLKPWVKIVLVFSLGVIIIANINKIIATFASDGSEQSEYEFAYGIITDINEVESTVETFSGAKRKVKIGELMTLRQYVQLTYKDGQLIEFKILEGEGKEVIKSKYSAEIISNFGYMVE